MSVRAVFGQVDPGCPADLQQGIEIDRHPVEMNDNQGLRLPRQPAPDLFRVRSKVPVLYIDQYGSRFEPPYRLQGGNKGVGRQNDFVSFADATSSQSQDQRLCT